jgi:GntR family transcriptional regulator
MMFEQLENTPLAERARGAILEAILTERFAGDRLPSEEELARMLNVSRTTIRTALHSLEQDGVITRRRAVGTTINRHVGPPMLALQQLVGFDWLLEESGHKVKADVSWARTPVPADMAVVFDLGPEGDYFVTSKRYYADGQLAISLRDIIPWSNLVGEIDDPPPPSLFEFSRRFCKDPIAHAVVRIVPMVKRKDEATQLEMPAGEPFIRLHERHYSTGGEPVGYSVIDVDDQFIRFEVFRRR